MNFFTIALLYYLFFTYVSLAYFVITFKGNIETEDDYASNTKL